MEAFLLEKSNVKQAFLPVDLNTAAVTGARVSMKDVKRCAIVVSCGASTAASVVCTLRQHNAASAGTSKDLSVMNRYFVKAGAATSFTETEPTVAAAAYTIAALADDEGLVVFEVLAEDLDVNGGFNYVSVDIADSAAAKIGAGLYILDSNYKPAYSIAI